MFAHFDGKPNFVLSKFQLKYVVPKVRKGRAAATCKLFKQVRCGPRKVAKMKAWQQEFGKERFNGPLKSVHRFLECSVSKTVKCEKVCLARRDNLGVNPVKKAADCGLGGVEVSADPKKGLF